MICFGEYNIYDRMCQLCFKTNYLEAKNCMNET
jgi:hypothetical protein